MVRYPAADLASVGANRRAPSSLTCSPALRISFLISFCDVLSAYETSFMNRWKSLTWSVAPCGIGSGARRGVEREPGRVGRVERHLERVDVAADAAGPVREQLHVAAELRVGRGDAGGLVGPPLERDDRAALVDRVQGLVNLAGAVRAEELDGDGLVGGAGQVLVRGGRREPRHVLAGVLRTHAHAARKIRQISRSDHDAVLERDPLTHHCPPLLCDHPYPPLAADQTAVRNGIFEVLPEPGDALTGNV